MEMDQKHLIEPEIGVARQITKTLTSKEECQTWFDHIATQGNSTPEIRKVAHGYEVWATRYR